jgi:hypothetical protein
MAKKRIKTPETKQGSRINISEPINYDQRAPIFSLERIQAGAYCFSALDKEGKAQFAEAIFKRKSLTWGQVKTIDRHGLGLEKIAKHSIKAAMPPFITDEFDDFIALRFNGKSPMVGYRLNDVFYVLWFDHNFTLYNH